MTPVSVTEQDLSHSVSVTATRFTLIKIVCLYHVPKDLNGNKQRKRDVLHVVDTGTRFSAATCNTPPEIFHCSSTASQTVWSHFLPRMCMNCYRSTSHTKNAESDLSWGRSSTSLSVTPRMRYLQYLEASNLTYRTLNDAQYLRNSAFIVLNSYPNLPCSMTYALWGQ